MLRVFQLLEPSLSMLGGKHPVPLRGDPCEPALECSFLSGLGGESAIECGGEMPMPHSLVADHGHEWREHQDN